ncbi:hypothetical protein ACFY0G_35020 [Streptomyces sp. NPDC001552]|uniref:hypothetical protein n=1 Tax=Streptomyces sp. NPDC001552 TaxID=3364587 RepID=UPI0036AE523B
MPDGQLLVPHEPDLRPRLAEARTERDRQAESRALVLCPGNMVHVAYAEARAWQLEFERAQQEAAAPTAVEEMLFEG